MNEFEERYVREGYELLPGWTWEKVREARVMWDTPEYRVPLAVAPGVIAWGVPFTSIRRVAS